MVRIWRDDRALGAALVVGAALRLAPIVLWWKEPCVRDECTYLTMARELLEGGGIVPTEGWLWAPGYPAVLALHGALGFDPSAGLVTQVVVALATIRALHALGERLFDRRAGRLAAWTHALDPTAIFYASSLWSEVFYGALLLYAVKATLDAREADSAPRPAVFAGALLGVAVLFRGIGTYLLPLFALALVWGRVRDGARWRQALALVAACALVVAPYAAHTSRTYHGLVVSDRTLGRMMWLGNNTFPPVTFDWGNGLHPIALTARVSATGRAPCDSPEDPVRQDACEVAAGRAWIHEHPGEFLARAPLRLAQTLNPHSFLTRHLRTGKWAGVPAVAREALIVLVPLWSVFAMVGGTLGLSAFVQDTRRRDAALLTAAVIGYHLVAVAALAGLTRYRAPLEPLWLVWAAGLVTRPREAAAAVGSGTPAALVGIVLTTTLLGSILRFAPAAWWPTASWWWEQAGW